MQETTRSDDAQVVNSSPGVADLLVLIFANLKKFLVAFLLVVSLAILFTIFAPKKYRASVELVPVQRQDEASGLFSGLGGLGGLASLAGLQSNTVPLKEEALASLRSKEFLFEFIVQNDLLPVLFSNKWDESANDWSVDAPEDIPTLWDGYQKLRRSVIRIFDDELTGLVTVSVEWTDREVAAKWANELIERLNRQIRERDIAESNKSLDYLKKELVSTQIVELQKTIYKLVEVEINKIMIANVREEYAFRIVDKAIPPDEDRFFFPRALIVIPIGFVLACGFALFVVLAWRLLSSIRSKQRG